MAGTAYEKVMARVATEGECLVFTGHRLKSGGYGQVSGYAPDWTPLRAHRVVYEHHHGPIPEGLVVRHRCDNPPCVLIDHLEIGTRGDNNRDAIERGRHGHGIRKGALSAEVVAAIRAAPTGAEAVRSTGVSATHVSRIRRGQCY